MGRKSHQKIKYLKPFCYYCDREFNDEFVLHKHQKARHFSCRTCHKKFGTAVSMATHLLQVHKEQNNRVPNAKAGRDAIELDIYGMDAVPFPLIQQRALSIQLRRKVKLSEVDEIYRQLPEIYQVDYSNMSWPMPLLPIRQKVLDNN